MRVGFFRPLLTVSTLALTILTFSACQKSDTAGAPGANQGPPPAEVSVAPVVNREVTEWDDFTGRVEAKEIIEIRPRVGGYLSSVNFDEGKAVKKGQLLFSIDDREYRAAVETAAANVARAQSRSEVAAGEVARSNKLLVARAVSQEEFATREGEMRQAVADVRSAQASLTQARLNLEFTRIESPIDGRIGVAMMRPGNLIAPGSTVLATVVSLDPMYVYFEGDERTYLKYQDMARAGERPSSRDGQSAVRMGLANEVIGWRIMTEQLGARIQLVGSGNHQAMLIHDQAVLTDQDRKFVYVLGPGNTALRKDVSLGDLVDGLRIVTGGLDAADVVVVNGMRKIFFPGMPLKANTVPMDAPNTPPPQPPSQGLTQPPAASAAAEKQG